MPIRVHSWLVSFLAMNATPRLIALAFLCFIPVLQAREPQTSPPSVPETIRARALGIPFDSIPLLAEDIMDGLAASQVDNTAPSRIGGR